MSRDGAATRARIKQQAMRLFVERGLDAVSVRDIAEAVGMKAPNLYAHFRARDALVAELFVEGYDAYGRALDAAADPALPAPARLAGMIRLICALHDQDRLRFRFLLLTQHGVLPGLPQGRSPIDVLQDVIAQGIASGELPPGDPALLAAMVSGIVLQAATFHLYGRLPASLGEVAEDLVAASLRLLQTSPPMEPAP